MTTTEENKCSICLKLFDDPRWIPCKHIYCFKCIPHLHRRELDTKDYIVLQCRICKIQHKFRDWSTVKYYVTLHCVPYLTTLKSPLIIKNFCLACFNRDLNVDYCFHCNKTICHECLIDHRMILKKNILYSINQCRLFQRKNEQNTQQILNKLENLKIHIDFCTCELIDQIDTYCHSIFTQIDEQKSFEETNSSSGYESLNEQRISDLDHDIKNISLTEPSVIPIQLIGELISSDSKLTSKILWTMTVSYYPAHIIFESNTSKLFICNHQGYILVYNYTQSCLVLINSFVLQSIEESQSVIIKSLTASESYLIVILNSSIKSILQFYSHNGNLLHVLSFLNEYISQIRFNNHHLWCLELISSSIFYFKIQSKQFIDNKKEFISFKQQSFNPFRFALNEIYVIIMDRALTGILLLYNKQTTSYLKQIICPLNNFIPYDIELTNHLLIYRFSHIILLTQLDNEEFLERIEVNKNLSLTIGKSDTEFLISTSTDDKNIFMIQSYVK